MGLKTDQLRSEWALTLRLTTAGFPKSRGWVMSWSNEDPRISPNNKHTTKKIAMHLAAKEPNYLALQRVVAKMRLHGHEVPGWP